MPLLETRGSSSALAYGLNSFKPETEFNYNSISGFWARWDASATNNIVSSTFVDQFTDQSGNGRHLTSTNSSRRPFVVNASKNGKNTLRFSGAQGQTTGSHVLQAPFTVFTVVKMYSMTSYNSIWDGVNNNEGNFTANGDIGSNLGLYTQGWVVRLPASNETWYRVTHILNTSGQQTIGYLNNNSATSATEDVGANFGGFRLGEGDGGGENANMEIAEVVIYTGALSQTNRDAINLHLSTKWGI